MCSLFFNLLSYITLYVRLIGMQLIASLKLNRFIMEIKKDDSHAKTMGDSGR